MIIAVSTRVTGAISYDEPRDAISHDWIRMLDERGLTPVLVPNILRDPGEFLRTIRADALLLTGGNDLGTDDWNASQDISSDRDQTERHLLNAAIRDGLPVFGVCRGMQLINHFFGGTTCRDMSSFGNHVATNHIVELAELTELKFDNLSVETNSFHNHGIVLDGLAEHLVPFATAEHDVVEGIVHETLPITAVQWHPERCDSAVDLDELLMERWLSKCA